MSILLIYRIKLIHTAIVFVFLNISCDISDDESTGMGIPSKSTPFICEDGNNFIKMGNTSNFNSFLIGDSQSSFYSISMDNHV